MRRYTGTRRRHITPSPHLPAGPRIAPEGRLKPHGLSCQLSARPARQAHRDGDPQIDPGKGHGRRFASYRRLWLLRLRANAGAMDCRDNERHRVREFRARIGPLDRGQLLGPKPQSCINLTRDCGQAGRGRRSGPERRWSHSPIADSSRKIAGSIGTSRPVVTRPCPQIRLVESCLAISRTRFS